MAGQKHDEKKEQIHLIPVEFILGCAQALKMGAGKYGKWNYREGIEYTRLIDSLMRHTLAYLNGEELDPESGLPHTYHMAANVSMLEWMRANKPEMDDRYKKEEARYKVPTNASYEINASLTLTEDELKKVKGWKFNDKGEIEPVYFNTASKEYQEAMIRFKKDNEKK